MTAIVLPGDYFEDIENILAAKFDFASGGAMWANAEAIAEIAGIDVNRSNLTKIGAAMRKLGVKTKRTSTSRLMLVPKVKQ